MIMILCGIFHDKYYTKYCYILLNIPKMNSNIHVKDYYYNVDLFISIDLLFRLLGGISLVPVFSCVLLKKYF